MGLRLDAVVELRVSEHALLQRVQTRVAQMKQRGEVVRADDTPPAGSTGFLAYRRATEPLIRYYADKGELVTVDGMMAIDDVTAEIDRLLSATRVT
jgi:adenylate kinase